MTDDDWVATTARLVRELTDLWNLTIDGPAARGTASIVVPVTTPDGPAALKLARPRPDFRDEHRALGVWGGRAAVRLIAVDPSRSAMLLERLDPSDLSGPPVSLLDACEAIGGVARALDAPAPPWLKQRAHDRLLALAADIDALRSGPSAHTLPRRMLDRGRSLALELAAEPGIDARLVHADLGYQHVLWRPEPGEWVAISPRPVAADPAWVVAPALWNRWDEAAAAYDTRIHLNFRLDVVCDVAGLDPARARIVSELRTLSNAVGAVAEQPTQLADTLTRYVTIIKALQPA